MEPTLEELKGLLADSERRRQAILDAVLDPIISIDAQGVIETVNGAAERVFGYASSELIGQNVRILMPEPDRSAHDRYLDTYKKTRVPKIIGIGRTVLGRRKDGSVFPAELTIGEAVPDGKPIYTGIIHDITNRQRAQRELEDTRERLELAIAGTSDGIWDWNIVESRYYDSPRLREMFGIRERPDWTIQNLLTDDEREKMERALRRHLDLGEPYDHEFSCLLECGELRWFRSRGEAVRNEEGTAVRMVGSITDVTERRRALNALEEMAETLSAKVHERTAELRRANNELERAGRAKDSFLASMSHELRTPLNAVLGLTEALNEEVYGPLNEDQRRALTTIDSSGKHLLALISDVLDLAKIHAGRLDLDNDPVAVRDLVHACLTYVRRQAENKRIHLALTELDPQLVMTTDGRRLRQILINLLANAVKFTPEGGRVTLDVRPRPEDEMIEFRIEDTGIGIPEEFILEIFEPFRQIDSKLSRQYDGTGLGLALVRELIDSFGGGMAVRSEVGRGSEFLVSLPWRRPDWHQMESHSAIRRAVVVGDEPAETGALVRYLRELGIESVAAGSGDALGLLVTQGPDVVFLDTIHSANGRRELHNLLRGQFPGLPLVISDPEDLSEADARLSRPVYQADVSRILAQLASIATPQPEVRPSGTTGAGIRILLAEDNEGNILATGDYLRNYGYEVLIARNGREAVEMTRDEKPALILMDIQMPVLDGLEAIRRIRKTGERVPIIALTALAMSSDRTRCLEAGADHYLSKPVRLSELRQTIEGCLRERET